MARALDGTFRISDIESGDQIYVDRRFDRALYSADFDPTGRRLLTLSSTRVIRVFDTKFVKADCEARRNMLPNERAERPLGDAPRQIQNVEDLEQFLGDPHLTEMLSRIALTLLVGNRVTTPHALNWESWEISRQEHRDPSKYTDAIKLARRATRLEPDNTEYQRTLGIGLYRAGKFREAAATLQLVDEAQCSSKLGAQPLTVAYLAMCFQRSGQLDNATSTLNRVNRLRQRTLTQNDTRDTQQSYKEVDALFRKN